MSRKKVGCARNGDITGITDALFSVCNVVAEQQVSWSIPKIIIVVKEYTASRVIASGELCKHEHQ